jgi:pyruvate-ferredoxin/flavodoxin oxidoreductase
VATHALSIFGDHSDVMATRSCGWALIASGGVQEAMDMALIAQAASLESRIPFLHFFDGFRTSHEVAKVEQLTVEDLRAMMDEKLIQAHRQRSMSPEHPVLRGTSQNPDVFFQARESANRYYDACPAIVQGVMNKFAGLVGRQYKLFDYVGAPDAERVVVMMGSGAEIAHETVDYLTERGEKLGLIKVRLYRPGQGRDCAGSDQGAWLRGRAALPGRGDRHRRSHGQRGDAFQDPAPDSHRALRPVLEGLHPGDGEGCF